MSTSIGILQGVGEFFGDLFSLLHTLLSFMYCQYTFIASFRRLHLSGSLCYISFSATRTKICRCCLDDELDGLFLRKG